MVFHPKWLSAAFIVAPYVQLFLGFDVSHVSVRFRCEARSGAVIFYNLFIRHKPVNSGW